MKFIIPFLICVLSLSCGDAANDDVNELQIIDQPLQGTINGENWSFKSGIATMTKTGEVRIEMVPYDRDQASPCRSNPQASQGAAILMSREPVVASRDMSLAENLTFSFENEDDGIDNHVATTGKWRFDFVDEDTIRGGLVAKTKEHEINGNFELTRCPDPFADF